jgi:hypothetical protein
MSRSNSDYFDEEFPGQMNLLEQAAHRALRGKRGRQALADLREALLALPDHRLIAGALSTYGLVERAEQENEGRYIDTFRLAEAEGKVEEQGIGVCAVGAYAWHKLVKSGMTPDEAFDQLPNLPDYDSSMDETAYFGTKYGLTMSLAWTLADINDETMGEATPEQRWERYIAWIDKELAVTSGT